MVEGSVCIGFAGVLQSFCSPSFGIHVNSLRRRCTRMTDTDDGRLARSAAPTGAGCRRRSDRAGLVGARVKGLTTLLAERHARHLAGRAQTLQDARRPPVRCWRRPNGPGTFGGAHSVGAGAPGFRLPARSATGRAERKRTRSACKGRSSPASINRFAQAYQPDWVSDNYL
jgi:hypothetical protein